MRQPKTKTKDLYFFVCIFTAGASTMAVEFAASRLLGNVFGTSNLVWAVIIGLVLVYLTLGNWFGGKLADKYPTQQTFYSILALAGIFIGMIPLVSRPILSLAADAFDLLEIGLLMGSFTVVLILFLIPVTLLGMVVPVALKLQISDISTTGITAGKVSAISTIGSILGTFFTVLLLIPSLGTYRTFLLISLSLILISLPGHWIYNLKLYFVLFSIAAVFFSLCFGFGLQGTTKSSQGQIYEAESSYNYIQVLAKDEFRFLRLNEGQGIHSVYHPEQLFYAGPWSQVLVAPYFNQATLDKPPVDRIAILGLAAGTTARQVNQVYPQAIIDGYEIDGEIVEIAKEYFGLNLANLTVHVEDARWGIAHSGFSYDIISVDAYQAPYIPAHMVTVEFFSEVFTKLTDQGVMTVNVGRSPSDRGLVDALTSTISHVFPQVFVTDLADSYNSVIFATKNPDASWANLKTNLSNIQARYPDSLLHQAMSLTQAGMAFVQIDDMIFTDDLAPIEYLTNKIVLDYVFFPEKEPHED